MPNIELDDLYKVSKEEKEAFGKHWVGPDILEHDKETKVASYFKMDDDGRPIDIKVYITAMPARFYSVTIDRGHPNRLIKITTGSGMRILVTEIINAILNGVLQIYA